MTLLQSIDTVRHLHRHPTLVAWATTTAGRLAILVAAAGLIGAYHPRLALSVVPLVALATLLPSGRPTALAAGAVATIHAVVLGKREFVGDVSEASPFVVGVVLLWVVLLYGGYRVAQQLPTLPRVLQRHILIVWHVGVWAALGAAWLVPENASGAGVVFRLTVACLPFFIWRVAYLLQSGRRGTVEQNHFADHLMYLGPVWGGSATPYGKGYDALRDVRGDDAVATARAQLAGVKLLCLAWMLRWVAIGVDAVSAHFALPTLPRLIAAPTEPSLGVAWTVLMVDLVTRVLGLAVTGHVAIAGLRLFGYYAFRNTYKPLLSESLVEFWNRYYYYFKELMAEFFFYPTYLGWFRTHPMLRLNAAVFAAAALGNTYYHVLADLPELAAAGPGGALRIVAPRVFYTVLLATGVCVSMHRQRALRAAAVPPSTLTRVRRIAGVWVFFALINIWNTGLVELPFSGRTALFLRLFGWS